MGTGEIRSPGSLPGTPAASMNLTANPEPFRRKKLEVFFIESDDRRTAFGRGYTGGTTPVNIHRKPIPDLSKTGGWIAAFFIFGKRFTVKFSFSQLTSPHAWQRTSQLREPKT